MFDGLDLQTVGRQTSDRRAERKQDHFVGDNLDEINVMSPSPQQKDNEEINAMFLKKN